MNKPTTVYTLIALGANIGDPIAQLREAVELLQEAVQLHALSTVYVTEPVGVTDQPDFYNLVLAGHTSVTVFRLLALGERIEQRLGRQRSVPNGPRALDVDLLAYGDLVYTSSRLTVPHPRLHERSFVLTPLCEIAGDWRHPLLGSEASDLSNALGVGSGVHRWGRL